MSRGRWVMRLYPRDWRRRYGEELDELIASIASEHGGLPFRSRVDLALSALQLQGKCVRERLGRHRRVVFGLGPVAIAVSLAICFGVLALGSSSPRVAQPPAATPGLAAQAAAAALAAAEARAAVVAQLRAEAEVQAQAAPAQSAARLRAMAEIQALAAQAAAASNRADQLQLQQMAGEPRPPSGTGKS